MGFVCNIIVIFVRGMQATTQQKQRYLREEILQQGYDPEQFIAFLCKDLKIQQLDVDAIDTATLQGIVFKFKQYKYYQQQPDPPKPQKKVKIQYDKNTYDYELEARCKCIHAEDLLKGVQVFVPNYEVKQKEGVFLSFGSKTEIWYLVQSTAIKGAVKRQQQDFQWLSDTIARLFPLQAIPELIPLAKQAENNYQKRRKELQEYLQILIARPELTISHLLSDFLTLPSDKLQKFRKNWDSMGFAKGIQSLKNQQGYVTVSYTNKLRNFAIGSSQFNRKAATVHEAIAGSLERVNQLHQATAEQLNKLVEHFAELHQAYNELTNKSPQQKVHEYNDILININNIFHIMAEDLNSRARIFSSHLKEFHKVQTNYDRSIAKLYRNLSQTEKEYVYLKTNLNRKKERLYPDVSRWQADQKLIQNRRLTKEQAFDLMLPKETQQQEQLRDWMAHLYGNYRVQFQRFINFEMNRYVSAFCTLSSELLLNNRTYVQEVTRFIEQSQKIPK